MSQHDPTDGLSDVQFEAIIVLRAMLPLTAEWIKELARENAELKAERDKFKVPSRPNHRTPDDGGFTIDDDPGHDD